MGFGSPVEPEEWHIIATFFRSTCLSIVLENRSSLETSGWSNWERTTIGMSFKSGTSPLARDIVEINVGRLGCIRLVQPVTLNRFAIAGEASLGDNISILYPSLLNENKVTT
jgi:hypothetical protein